MDEEIESDEDEDLNLEEDVEKKGPKGGALENDPFFSNKMDGSDNIETVEEKRLRMTKQLLAELQTTTDEKTGLEKEDFFDQLQAKTSAQVEIFDKEDDLLTRKLKYQILEKKGKLFYEIANEFKDCEFDRVFIKGHKKAITALEWSQDNKSVFTASKDCCLIQWDLESQKKLIYKGEKHNREIQGHYDEPLCMAVSPNGKYLVSGGKDRIVRIWDIHSQKQIQTFIGHRDSITGIKFDRENDQFYTVSNDRSLKVWNIREMAYMDSHYGHQSDILDIDTYSQDRVLSCGLDRQVIFWKVNEDSELLYKNEKHTVDTINIVNNQFFITGSSDNVIDLWIMNKKRPIFTLGGLHEKNSWILSTANIRNSDVFTSASYDGQVIFYKLNKDAKNFEIINRVKNLPGCINSMKFSNHKSIGNYGFSQGVDFSSTMLAVTHSKDEKNGRWHTQKGVKEGITIMRKIQQNICVIGFFLFLLYMGQFHKVEIKEDKFRGGYYVYKNFQSHLNNQTKIRSDMLKELKDNKIDSKKSDLAFLTLAYDDPYNLEDPNANRTSNGFLFKKPDNKLLERFKEMKYQWTELPETNVLTGYFPFRFSSSIAFGATRFYPTCWLYIQRNKKKLIDYLDSKNTTFLKSKCGTLELIDGHQINFYVPLDKQVEFYLTQFKQPDHINWSKFTSTFYSKNV